MSGIATMISLHPETRRHYERTWAAAMGVKIRVPHFSRALCARSGDSELGSRAERRKGKSNGSGRAQHDRPANRRPKSKAPLLANLREMGYPGFDFSGRSNSVPAGRDLNLVAGEAIGGSSNVEIAVCASGGGCAQDVSGKGGEVRVAREPGRYRSDILPAVAGGSERLARLAVVRQGDGAGRADKGCASAGH